MFYVMLALLVVWMFGAVMYSYYLDYKAMGSPSARELWAKFRQDWAGEAPVKKRKRAAPKHF